jgi:hypothetical protein
MSNQVNQYGISKRLLLGASTLAVLAVMGCGKFENTSQMTAQGDFDEAIAKYSQWTPVLKGDVAFPSRGHGGITVKGYINPVGQKFIDQNENPYPLAIGTVIAKAVVKTAETPSTKASRVYFMRKENPGFDAANGDWSYGIANRVGDVLVADKSVDARDKACISCHVKFRGYDFVKTVDFYKKQIVK